MQNIYYNYYDDPIILAAKSILEGNEACDLDEGVEEIKKTVEGLKVGDKTNFGVIKKIDSNSITFKAKDLPETKISFGQRKTGSKEYVLDKLTKMESVSSSDDIPLLDEEFITAMNERVNGYSLGEAASANPSSPQLLKADYILFLDNQELYQISPSRSTKMIGTNKDVAKLPVTAWTRVNLATGEDVSELGLGKVSTDELGSWFIVGTKFPQNKAHPALVGTK